MSTPKENAVDGCEAIDFANAGYSTGSARMSEFKLLQRLATALATNEGLKPKWREILQRLKSLSPREVDVLCYVLDGQLNREIAAELGISLRTTKVHRGRVMKKLGMRSTAQLFPMVWRVLCESGFKIFYKPRRQVRSTESENQGSLNGRHAPKFLRIIPHN